MPRKEGTGEDEVRLALMSHNGTRDEAANFQMDVRKFMANCGFAESRYNPTVYCHQTKNIRTLVRWDDFVSNGYQENWNGCMTR